MSNSEKGTKNSGTHLHADIIVFTKTTFFPAARIKNVELIGSLIGGSADFTFGTFRMVFFYQQVIIIIGHI